MNFFSKLVIAVLVILSIFYVKDNFLNDMSFEFPIGKKEPVKQKEIIPSTETKKSTKPVSDNTIKIYFAKEKNDTTNLKPIKRQLPKGQSKLEFAILELLRGPSGSEKSTGAFSEIPNGTRLLAIREDANSVIIDISEDFQYGGGTQSQYIRVKQLIKTVLGTNPKKPVYLYLNGQKAEVIGGEGIILNQPLSENSLND